MANNVEITVTATNHASQVFRAVDNDAKSLSGRLKSTLGNVSQIAGGMALAGGLEAVGQKVLSFASDSISAAKDSKAANAQLAQVLKSTGGAAGLTADELKKMASQMEKVSMFEDEAIINAQSLLLTFTNIGKDVFPEATQTVLDMSQALGQDLKSSSIQLGKALNDPVNGITALTRVGVSFTEQQKEQIETMAEAGNVAGAQKLILEELTKEFGGQAKAASDAAGASERQKDRMNELNEVIGEKLLPIQEKWKEAQIVAINFLISKVIPALEELYEKHWPAIEKVLREQVIPAINALIPVFKFMAENAIEKIKGMAQAIAGVIEVITRVVNTVKAIIHGDWAKAWDEFKGIPQAILDGLEGLFRSQLGKLPELFYNAGKDAGDALWDGIKKGAGKLLSMPGLGLPGLGLPGRASGGPVSAGRPYMVGERGPELFVPKWSGQILPNSSISKITERIRAAAMARWPGNRRFQAGEIRAAMDGLRGFRSGQRVAPEWMQAYGSLVPRRAGGGQVLAGMSYIVGERGPELFQARASGQITSNAGLRGMAGAKSVMGGEPGMAVTIRGDVIVNNNGATQDADGAIRALGYMIRAQARSRGAALAV